MDSEGPFKINYAVVEDNQSFRETLVNLLQSREDTSTVAEYSSSEEFLHSGTLTSIDFLIVDYRLDKMDGIALLGQIEVQDRKIPKMILTGYDAEDKIFEALKYGAAGYVFKEELFSLNSILDILLTGGAYISPRIALRVANYFRDQGKAVHSSAALTSREEYIIQELSNGYSLKEISEILSISLFTVRTHIRNIYKKLEVSNQIQLLKKVKNNQI